MHIVRDIYVDNNNEHHRQPHTTTMWNDQEEEKKTATWEEHSQLYRDFHRQLTVSEVDRPHKCVVFAHEQSVPSAYSTSDGGDDEQTNFLSQFTIVSHQGTHAVIILAGGTAVAPKVSRSQMTTLISKVFENKYA